MWLDLLLILLAVSPLMLLSRSRCQNPGNTPGATREARPMAWPVPR
jgi:hypothetical protein